MGSFNSSCVISNIDIKYNEPIVAFVVSANKNAYNYDEAHLIYPWDKNSIISLPIYGRYDDYGGIIPDDPTSDTIKNLEELFPNSTIIDKNNDNSLNHELFRGSVIAYNGKNYNIGLMMIHRSVYDNIMTDYKKIDGYQERLKAMIDYITNQYGDEYDEFINKSHSDEENRKRAKGWIVRDKLRCTLNFHGDREIVVKYGTDNIYNQPNVLAALLMGSYSRETILHDLTRLFMVRKVRETFELDDKWYDRFHAYSELNALANAMQTLGKVVAPTLYMGQESFYDDHLKNSLDNIKFLFNKIAEADHDYLGGEDDLDKSLNILEQFYQETKFNLEKWKQKCQIINDIDRE